MIGNGVCPSDEEIFCTWALTKRAVDESILAVQLEKEIDDYPEHVCISCQCLYQRKSVTKVKLSDNLSSNVWPRIKDYVLGQNPNAGKDETLYMCNYCKYFIKKDVTFKVCPQWT